MTRPPPTPPLHSHDPERLFFLVGPTGSGKSAVAVEVAKLLDAEIVGADAFQVYAGLPILTAQPGPVERAGVAHHLVGCISPESNFDAGQYLRQADAAISEIQDRGRSALVVGGTGLYIRALTHGLAELPPPDPVLRSELQSLPLAELQTRLLGADPSAPTHVDFQNPRRMVRALEIVLQTGQPSSQFRSQWEQPPRYRAGLQLSRSPADLAERIRARIQSMIDHGVLAEIRAIQNVGSTASKAIGFRELRAVLDGEMALTDALLKIETATRQYAKRQRTWFRRAPSFCELPLQPNTDPANTAAAAVRLLRQGAP